MSVKFKEAVGRHGANLFFKEFSVSCYSGWKTYHLGSFYFVRKEPNPVTLAELQLIWKNINDGNMFASVKLYFNPHDEQEHTMENIHEYGKDEVIEADRQVVIECSQFPTWECPYNLWSRKRGEAAFAGVPKEYIKKIMQEDCRSSEFNEDAGVKILSFPQYCRFKACLQLLKLSIPMPFKSFIARGGIRLTNLNTRILFSRWKFSKAKIEDYTLTQNISVPVFKGRPRRKKDSEVMIKKKRKPNFLNNENSLCYKRRRSSNLSNGLSQKYLDCPSSMKSNQDTSVNCAALRIKRKYRKKIERTEFAVNMPPGKKDEPMKTTKISDAEVREEFKKDLYSYMSSIRTPILRIPYLGRAEVDLYDMYILVAKYGGYAQVTLKRQWRQIYDELERHSKMATNSATSTRKIYERLLLPYEKYARKRVKGKQILKSIALDKSLKSKNDAYDVRSVNIKNEDTSGEDDIPLAKVRSAGEDDIPLAKVRSYGEDDIPLAKVKSSLKGIDADSAPCNNNETSHRIQLKPLPCKDPPRLPNRDDSCTNSKTAPDKCNGVPNKVDKNQCHSFTLQAGGAFKLMIQKRRGRPSKEFREQIEQLKTMNHKVEVEVYPPLGKKEKLPTWMNDLNVDIINRVRKRKNARNGCDKSNIDNHRLPSDTRATFVNNLNDAENCTKSNEKSGNSLKSSNDTSLLITRKGEEVRTEISTLKNPTESKDTHEFAINPVRSQARTDNITTMHKPPAYIHYPYNASNQPITVPQSVLKYENFKPSVPQSVLSYKDFKPTLPQSSHSYNDLKPTYVNSHLERTHKEVVSSHYPLSSSSTGRNKSSTITLRKREMPLSDCRNKTQSSVSYENNISIPTIHQVYYPRREPRMYYSNHRLTDEDTSKRESLHLEKVFIHHPSYTKPPPYSEATRQSISYLPRDVNRIHGHVKPSNTMSNHTLHNSASNVTFHSYRPPTAFISDMPPVSDNRKPKTEAPEYDDIVKSTTPIMVDTHHGVSMEPEVYILPQGSWPNSETSV